MHCLKRFITISLFLTLANCGDAGDDRTDGGGGGLFFEIGSPSNFNEDVSNGTEYEIKIIVENASNDASYSLYYVSFAGSCTGAGGTAIVEDEPASGTFLNSYIWNVNGVANGTYCIYGTLTDGTKSSSATSTGSFKVDAAYFISVH